MKKFLTILLVLALATSLFIGCTPKDKDGDDGLTTINVVVPDGAPALAIAKLLKDKPTFDGYKINYEIVDGVNNLKAKVTTGGADIAVLPTNLAAVFYNKELPKNEPMKLVASNIFGLFYMLGKAELTSIDDLKGKVVYLTAQGGTPDLVFQQILTNNNIEYKVQDTEEAGLVSIKYAANSQSLITLMLVNKVEYAVFGEPQLTQAINETAATENKFVEVLNFQEEWQNGYAQVSTVAKTSIINDHSEFLSAFLLKVKENVDWIIENPNEAVKALTDNGSAVSGYTKETIERCNIRFEYSKDIKEDIENYLQVMYNFDATSVGGKMPSEEFYN